MKNKRFWIGSIYMLILTVFMICGLAKINMTNTRALSPLGNTNENYEIVSEEFGEDFSNFIRDNSEIKIYKDEQDIIIRIGEENFRINDKSAFKEDIEKAISKIKKIFDKENSEE